MTSAATTFLRACAASGPADWDGRGAELRALAAADWKAVNRYAVQHGLAGLVARSLGWAEEATGFRAPARDSLDELRRGQLIRNLADKAAARRIARALAEKSIPFVAFKGIVLTEEIYGDLSLRDFCDFDAMVPRDRIDEAFAVATDLGYRLISPITLHEYVRAGAHAAGMEHPDGTGFDLHWNIAPDLALDKADIVWRHCLPPDPGADFPGMRFDPEMTLIHLAKHLHSAQYAALRPLVDFHVASRKFAGQVDAARIAATARELDLESVLEIVNALRERHLVLSPPSPGPPASASLKARVALRFVTQELLLDSPHRSRIGNWLRYLVAAGSLGATLHGLVEIVLPGRLTLVQFFRRPFGPDMYPRYYWRQLLKVVTLARK